MTTATETLIAYHGDEELKARIMAQIQAHREADEIAKGSYYREGDSLKVCAVGCVLHDATGGHMRYETEFGIPAQLAHLEDGLFEAMELPLALEWPARFMASIRPGADLWRVWPQFAVWLLLDEEWGVVHTTDVEEVKEICRRVAEGYQRALDGDPLSAEDTEALGAAVWAVWAARAARDAWTAWDAAAARDAWAARAARDAWTAWDAAAARDAWAARDARAVWAAWDARAARDAWAVWAARDARAVWAARDARAALVEASADKLIELIAAA